MTLPLTPREAALQVLEDVRVQPPLRMPLDDALGSVLAEDIVTPVDIPAWTNAAMDGYAVRAEDVRGASEAAPVRLQVLERIPAGTAPTRTIGPGECARIFTGGALPAGADSVVRQEDTDLGTAVVTVRDDRDAGANVRQAGEDVRRGTVVLCRGTALGAAELGVLASLAVAHPVVHRRPIVAIMGSGDEIVDIDQPEEILAGRKLGSSNTHSLMALVRLAGGEPLNLGVARDTPASFRDHLRRAQEADLLVTSAGISVGEHDFVRPVLEEMGATQKFWRLRMRPGAPVGFGMLGDAPWIGLPGNPVSTMVTFELFVRAAIRRMCGHALPFRRSTPVRLAAPISVTGTLQHFLRGIVTWEADGPVARLTGPQGSGILTSMVRANALLVIPEGQFHLPAGTQVAALLLDDPRHQAEPAF